MSEDARRNEPDRDRDPSDERIAGKFSTTEIDEEVEPSIEVDTPDARRKSMMLESQYLLVFGEPVPSFYLSYETEEEYQELVQNALEQGLPIDTRPGPNNIGATDQV
jgi:hypothetical protein